MAGTIKGITIEIGGNTVGLQKALSDVNKKSSDLQSELKQVERALKFNPGNVELLAQKQQLLTEQVSNTTERLKRLKDAQSQVEAQFQKGDIGADQYRAFQREIIQTESKLNGLQQSLREVNTGSGVTEAKTDLQHLEKEAGNAKEAVGHLGGELAGLAAGLAAGGGLAGVIEKSLDTSSLNTKIDISFDVPPESTQSVKNAINTVSSYGVDAEAALEGVRQQWALNKSSSDETNASIVKGAAAIASTYSGLDFTEVIQQTNKIGSELGISSEGALGLTNALLKVGFPPDQIDIISEYGGQLTRAGYDATEVQAIMSAGIDTGTWNIDNLLDGLKEGRIRMAEFGQGIPKALDGLLKGTDISAKQMQEWGQAVANGGEGGKKAMTEVAAALANVKDETLKNALGVQIFGTMWEDQGSNLTYTLLGAQSKLVDFKKNQDQLNDSVAKMDASPAVQLQQSFANLNTALQPLYGAIANMVSKFADWVSKNPELAASITAVATAIGILMGILMVLGPIFTALSIAAGAFELALLPFIGVVAAVIVGIGLLIAAGIAIYRNWDSISKFLSDTWNSIVEAATSIFSSIGSFFTTVWAGISSTVASVWTSITSFLSSAWASIVASASAIWNGLVNVFTFIFLLIQNIIVGTWTVITSLLIAAWNIIVALTAPIWQPVAAFFTALWSGIQSVSLAVWGAIQAFFSAVWSGIVAFAIAVFTPMIGFYVSLWNAISSVAVAVWNGIMSFLGAIWNGISSVARYVFSAMASFLSAIWSGISSAASSIWNGIKSAITSVVNGISSTVSSVWNGIKSATSSVWEGIKSAIMTPINAARDGVRSAIESIKGFFSGLVLKLPHIDLPHFGLSGNFSLNPPSVPSLTVDWYKNGGLFPANSPRLVGMGDASVPEMALPLSDKVLGNLANMLAERMAPPVASGPSIVQLVIDGRTLGEVLIDGIDLLQSKKLDTQLFMSGVK